MHSNFVFAQFPQGDCLSHLTFRVRQAIHALGLRSLMAKEYSASASGPRGCNIFLGLPLEPVIGIEDSGTTTNDL